MAIKQPSILILFGDDIGWWNISYNNRGETGYRTPNIDRVASEGAAFTDYCATEPHRWPRRFDYRTESHSNRPDKVGVPDADVGLQ